MRLLDVCGSASRAGDFDALLQALVPEVVLRVDRAVVAGASREIRGAAAVAAQALTYSRLAPFLRPALVNGAAGGLVVTPDGQPISVLGFTVTRGKIVEIDIFADPARLRRLDLAILDEP